MWTEEGGERRGDYDCWKEEGNGGEGAEESLAAKVEAGEEDGRGDSEGESEDGGEGCLVKSKKYYVLRVAQVFEGES